MRVLLTLLATLLVLFIVLGFYLDWFWVSTARNNEKVTFAVTADTQKVKEDSATATEKLKTVTENLKEKAKNATVVKKVGDEKEAYKQKTETALKDFSDRIDELRATANALDSQAREQFDQEIDEALRARAAAHKKFEELKAAEADRWQALKAALDADMETLRQAYERALARAKGTSR